MKKEFQLWTRDVLWPKTISGIVIKDKRAKTLLLISSVPATGLPSEKEGDKKKSHVTEKCEQDWKRKKRATERFDGDKCLCMSQV